MDALFTILFSLLVGFFGDTSLVSEDKVPVRESVPVVSVIDGDTIVVLRDGIETSVRYIGIDTPEPRTEPAECYSQAASDRNRSLVTDRVVELEADEEDRDRYGRLLRYVYVDGVLVNEILVQEGFATPLTIPPNDRYAAVFTRAADGAQERDLGLWSHCR